MWCVLDPVITRKNYNYYLLCQCKCGAIKKVHSNKTTPYTNVCNECRINARKTETPVVKLKSYRVWGRIKERCTNPNKDNYADYGGRGISISKEWQQFSNFRRDMGEPPAGMHIDRIDVNGDYCKENCRWVTPLENNRNKRNTIWVMLGDVKMCLSVACSIVGLIPATVYGNMRDNKCTPEEAIIRLIGKGMSSIARLN